MEATLPLRERNRDVSFFPDEFPMVASGSSNNLILLQVSIRFGQAMVRVEIGREPVRFVAKWTIKAAGDVRGVGGLKRGATVSSNITTEARLLSPARHRARTRGSVLSPISMTRSTPPKSPWDTLIDFPLGHHAP